MGMTSKNNSPIEALTHVTVYVEDHDEAMEWYRDKLGFVVRSDEKFDGGRWLTVSPHRDSPVEFVLMEPDEPDAGVVGMGTMWVVRTSDCRGAAEALMDRGVEFVSGPEEVPWGVSAIFQDLYGNPYNLLEPVM